MRRRTLAAVTGLFVAVPVVVVLVAPITTASAASVAAKKAPACAGTTKKAAIRAIAATFDIVMNGTVSGRTLDEKLALIEDSEDPSFRAALNDIATANADALLTTSVDVQRVTCTGKRSADVVFELVLSGEPEHGLAPPGSAVVSGSVWKMTQATACNLVALADPTLFERGSCAIALTKRT